MVIACWETSFNISLNSLHSSTDDTAVRTQTVKQFVPITWRSGRWRLMRMGSAEANQGDINRSYHLRANGKSKNSRGSISTTHPGRTRKHYHNLTKSTPTRVQHYFPCEPNILNNQRSIIRGLTTRNTGEKRQGCSFQSYVTLVFLTSRAHGTKRTCRMVLAQ